jgi:hypothetical protein
MVSSSISCEFEMQDAFSAFLEGKKIPYVAEAHVPQVGRIADFLILKNDKLINVEAKCHDFKCVMQQLRSHSMYCDYSFAYIPDYCLTPKWFKKELMESGFGLIAYNVNTKIVTEVFEAHINKGLSKTLRDNWVDKLRTHHSILGIMKGEVVG